MPNNSCLTNAYFNKGHLDLKIIKVRACLTSLQSPFPRLITLTRINVNFVSNLNVSLFNSGLLFLGVGEEEGLVG